MLRTQLQTFPAGHMSRARFQPHTLVAGLCSPVTVISLHMCEGVSSVTPPPPRHLTAHSTVETLFLASEVPL